VSIKGKVRLAGDLAGTADNPSVPGLATKSDKGHTHPVAEVTGLSAALDGKVDKVSAANRLYGTNGSGGQSSWPLSGLSAGEATVPLRTTGGAIVAGEPTAANHAVTKAYADRRPALFSGAGAPPTSIPGAVVGDWWLNESTMELSKITGV
jgi:hypothetical protein